MKLSEFPNMVQVRSAKEFLTDFLINGQQFCDAVEEMEYVGRVIRFDLLHYIFKFRMKGSPWYLGVCGGFSSDTEMEPGIYVGADSTLFCEDTYKKDAERFLDQLHTLCDDLDMQNLVPDEKEIITGEDVSDIAKSIQNKLAGKGIDADLEELKKILGGLTDNDDGKHKRFPFLEDEEFTVSCRVLLSLPVPDLTAIAHRLEHTMYHPGTYEIKDGALCMNCQNIDVKVFEAGRVSEKDIPFLQEETGKSEALSAYKKHSSSLLIEVTGRDGADIDQGFLLAHVAAAAVELSQGVAVVTDVGLFPKDKYLTMIEAADYDRLLPIDAFLRIVEGNDETGSFLRTVGLKTFDHEEMITDVKTDGRYDEEWKEDLKDIAYEILVADELTEDLESSIRTYGFRYIMRGNSGYTYNVFPEGTPTNMDDWRVTRTSYVWMDEETRIKEDLRSCHMGVAQPAQYMNRLAIFILWAYDRRLLNAKCRGMLEYLTSDEKYKGDVRSALLEVSSALDSRIFLKKARDFVEDYYSMRHPNSGYYRDLQQIAISHQMDPCTVAHMMGAGANAISLLSWTKATFAEVSALLDRKYEAYQAAKKAAKAKAKAKK